MLSREQAKIIQPQTMAGWRALPAFGLGETGHYQCFGKGGLLL
jgi:hypothetical protein